MNPLSKGLARRGDSLEAPAAQKPKLDATIARARPREDVPDLKLLVSLTRSKDKLRADGVEEHTWVGAHEFRIRMDVEQDTIEVCTVPKGWALKTSGVCSCYAICAMSTTADGQTLAGISLAEADVLRKAVGKKDAELIKAELGKFTEKAVARGHDAKIIEDLAGQIETFGRYGFNKSHSVAYSVVAFHTAYLKAHYPADFMAALLSSCIGDTDSVVKYIAEARELGLEILPPDVNECGYKFTVIGDKQVRFGLGAVRNVGSGAVDSILEGRVKDGAFGQFKHTREPAPVDRQLIVRLNRDTIYSSGVFDLDAGPAGHLRFSWSPFDHLQLTDADVAALEVPIAVEA